MGREWGGGAHSNLGFIPSSGKNTRTKNKKAAVAAVEEKSWDQEFVSCYEVRRQETMCCSDIVETGYVCYFVASERSNAEVWIVENGTEV